MTSHLVLESLPWRNVRHRSHGLHAAARGDGPHAVPEVCASARDLDHCRRIDHFDLYDNAVLSTEVTALDWDDTAKRIIRTNRGDEMRAKFVAMGTSSTGRNCWHPERDLEGHSFHTSRWDYGVIGGNLRVA